MNKRPIGFLDSGIGGISVLNEVRKLLPNEDYLFYADSVHNPYGDKTKEQLQELVDHIMSEFLKKRVKLVVVACNTASTQVISYLREKYPTILFVATEPAIKVAYDHYQNKNTLVMATPGTIHSERLLELDQRYHQENRTLLSCSFLAQLIENQQLDQIPGYLEKLFQNIDRKQVEVVVLGCTHYPFINQEIEKAIGHAVIFLDGSIGIAKRVKQLLEENNLQNLSNHKGKLSFILTNPETEEVVWKLIEEKSYVLSSISQ